jgi:hypothetical protein
VYANWRILRRRTIRPLPSVSPSSQSTLSAGTRCAPIPGPSTNRVPRSKRDEVGWLAPLPRWCWRGCRRQLGQRATSLLVVIASVALTGGLAGLDTVAPARAATDITSTSGSASPIAVNVGYVDTHHVTSWPFPNPWMGSPNTVFVGVPDSSSGGWDASALRIDNTSAGSLTGVTVSVDMGGHQFALWGTNTIPAGQSLILTRPPSRTSTARTPIPPAALAATRLCA